MARVNYCKHDTYIGGTSTCWQCQEETNGQKAYELHEWLLFKNKVRQAMEELKQEKKQS